MAQIFDSLELDVLLMVAERMSERKLAPVMALMNPDRAREMTIELTRQRSQANSWAGDQPEPIRSEHLDEITASSIIHDAGIGRRLQPARFVLRGAAATLQYAG